MKKFFRTKQLVAFLLIVAMLIPTTNIHTVYAAPETSGYNDTVLASLSESRVFLRAGKSKKNQVQRSDWQDDVEKFQKIGSHSG